MYTLPLIIETIFFVRVA